MDPTKLSEDQQKALDQQNAEKEKREQEGLPVELISHVIRLALPSRYSPLTYRDRQDTLLALCLSSKSLRNIAQLWLFEEAKVETEQELESFLDEVSCTKSGWLVKLLHLQICDDDSLPTYELPRFVIQLLARLCPNVVELWVEGAPDATEIYLADLERFSKLERLIMDYLILTAPKPFSLPVLQELSLSNCTADSEHTVWTVYSTPRAQTPALRTLPTFAPPTLFSSSLFRHVETLFDPSESDKVCAKLEQVASLLSRGASPHLRSLYLPMLLHPSSPMLPAIRLWRDWLLEACQEHKVEVVYEPPMHFLLDSMIP
ncbi:hypothetical protein JCM8547_005340 [Rhodosporidiobolus lusitaniae]